MPRPTTLLLALATLSATTILYAQSPDPAGPASAPSYNQSQPAPIERPGASYPGGYGPGDYTPHSHAMRPGVVHGVLTATQPLVSKAAVTTAEPAPGLFVRLAPNSSVSAVVLTPSGKDAKSELRLDRGLVNISVHHPDSGSQILVDLPGGQTSLLKDGFYTFNAATNTVRVLRGEAIAFPPSQKRVKVKEDHAVTLNGTAIKSREFDPMEARADLIPYNPQPDGANYALDGGGYGYLGYGEGFYGEYGYPYYGYGDGYPYGFYGGYPYGIGLGFGYYGGFGGGYRGGYGGFRGGGFRGGGFGHR